MFTPFRIFHLLTIAGSLISVTKIYGQTQRNRLDSYIDTAFARNQGLKEKQFDLDKALFSLKEAHAMFLPTVSFLASYTKASGGRTIDVPLGDLVNPIYTALNELAGSNKYQLLKNESFLLNPDNFYDAKVRTSLPLVNAEIYYNKEIRKQLISAQQASVNVYKRTLVKDIKTAYYKYYQALQSIETYNSALSLIRENIRENESMLRNGVKNATALLRSQTEQQKISADMTEARYIAENAKAYFNFLLNRPLKDTIIIEVNQPTNSIAEPDTTSGTSGREELKQIQSMQQVYDLDYKLQKAGIIPKLSTFIDLGSQGFNFNVNDKSKYYLWGVNLQWDIFTGGQRKARAQQSRASFDAATAQLSQTQQSLNMSLTQSYNNYHSAAISMRSAGSQLNFATKYYNDQLKAYKAGQLLYLELIDAQNQLTEAKLLVAQAQANLQIAIAELERDQAQYPLNNESK